MSDNPYYDNAFGLTKFCEVELREPDYSFDLAVVWRHEDGSFYAATDSGCSCPTPFDDVHSLSDLAGPYDRAGTLRWLADKASDAWDAGGYLRAVEAIVRAAA